MASLRVLSQSGQRFSSCDNKTTLLINAKLGDAEIPALDVTKQYIVCRLLPDEKYGFGKMIYAFATRVISGDLSGATLLFRSGKIYESFFDPLLAVFEVPAHVTLKPQVLPLEVVRMRVK